MSTPPDLSPVKRALLEKLHHTVLPVLEQLVAALPDSLTDAAQAERQIRAGALAAARHLLQAWGQAADPAVARPECPHCRLPMRHKGYRAGTSLTTLGAVSFRRARFRCAGCGQECYPHDADLRFLGHTVSWPLAQVVSRQAAQGPFAQARDNLADDYGVRLAKQTVAAVCQAAGGEALRQEDERRHRVAGRLDPLPDSPLAPDRACLFADGTTVHTAGDWHEVRVATATAADAAGKPLARQSRARFLPVADFAWVLLLLARAVGYQHARLRAFLADGAHWLWKLAEDYFPSAIQILDWYHLAEHVHKAAAVLFGEGSAGAAAWAAERKGELWEGRVGATLEAVAREARRVRSAAKRAALHELRGYLENNRGRMDYPRYRELGLPVGSGQVEAQCKALVGARCKQAGMRNWTYDGAEAVLRLRGALQDGSFARLWQNRLKPAA
jgi:predicted hotdog family 3-hydroxylacyl-ACP dehydratase